MDKEATQQWLTVAFHAVLDTEKGKKLTEKAKTDALDIDDVCEIHDSLVAADPRLRNPLGIPVLFDVIHVWRGLDAGCRAGEPGVGTQFLFPQRG